MTIEKVQPNKNIVYSVDGDPIPFDVVNKTLSELKEMGFKDVMSFTMKHDEMTGEAKPHMPAEEKRRLQQILNDMQADKVDPNFNLEVDESDDEN